MREILNNKFMMVAAITNEITTSYGNRLNYDYDEVIFDASNSINQYISESNLDRRVVAVGAEPRIHIWDLLSSNIDGWKDHMYLASGPYAQMLAQIKSPASSLIFEPDRQFELVATLSVLGSSITFVNSECLLMFESFIRDQTSYPFSFDYTTIDMQDLESPSDEIHFDFIAVSMVDLVNDFDIINQCVDLLNPGGIIYVAYANESGRLYSEDYYVEPVTEVYERILSLDGVSTYHMSNSIGFQIIIKD
jgi:hypothetical protein